MIRRYSSRRTPLVSFLAEHLRGAQGYDRIAGYFSSSILEVAGEALEEMAPEATVRVVCNSSLDELDVRTAQAAKQAMYREWCASLPEELSPSHRARLERLYRFLREGRLTVRVIPDSVFGLVHGKAGVIVGADGARICFLGSTNESKAAFRLNYELVWTDDSADGVDWVQEEFDSLWNSPLAVELADAVIQEAERQVRRRVIVDVPAWKRETGADPAAPVIELPVYRRENGLWAHQKYFVRQAFAAHQAGGARYLLADQVGLGKTVQLGLAARLMALVGEGRLLALVPKPLLFQWQEELWNLISFPSAVWNGRQWVDENGLVYPGTGTDDLARCPRRLGIVSTGLITQAGPAADVLRSLDYDCVILDEAHRARRRNLGPAAKDESPDPNNLLRFLQAVAPRTKSLLLATATPVQIDPIEAWDLLEALNRGHEGVLGSRWSRWYQDPRGGLALAQGRDEPPTDLSTAWEWIRDPLPPSTEGRDYAIIRSSLGYGDDRKWAAAEDLDRLSPPDRARLEDIRKEFFGSHNPFIRHIVRRTRAFLEENLDPETNEPYLKPVRVRLFGERPEQAVVLPTYLRDVYEAAEDFCSELGRRPGLNSGFLKTLLLRRVGSSIYAGKRTAEKMLAGAPDTTEDEDDREEAAVPASTLYPLTNAERNHLERFLSLLEAAEADPKEREVERILLQGAEGTRPWLEEGCIVFSQYYDSVQWLAQRLSERLVDVLEDGLVGVYAGGSKSGVYREGRFSRLAREQIKAMVGRDEIRLLIGTDAASEGLNLQRLGTLINLDLPWNPTRLEQRKGRIQRIGQVRDEVYVYNMRYRGSVEDRVHQLLSSRLEAIRDLFGQLPDTLEDVWVEVALRDEEKAKQVIDAVPPTHPFEMKYDRVEHVDWESCAEVLDSEVQLEVLQRGW